MHRSLRVGVAINGLPSLPTSVSSQLLSVKIDTVSRAITGHILDVSHQTLATSGEKGRDSTVDEVDDVQL